MPKQTAAARLTLQRAKYSSTHFLEKPILLQVVYVYRQWQQAIKTLSG
jgi:hypothetical protein